MEIEPKENKKKIEKAMVKTFDIQFQDPYLAELYYLLTTQADLMRFEAEHPEVTNRYPRIYEFFYKAEKAREILDVDWVNRDYEKDMSDTLSMSCRYQLEEEKIKKNICHIPYVCEPINFIQVNESDVFQKLHDNKLRADEVDILRDQEKLEKILTEAEFTLLKKIKVKEAATRNKHFQKKLPRQQVPESPWSEDIQKLRAYIIHKLDK
jgi:hypothetical protein